MSSGSTSGDVSPPRTPDGEAASGEKAKLTENQDAADRMQLRRLSVKDLASKFEKGQASSPGKLSPPTAKARDSNQGNSEDAKFHKLKRMLSEMCARVAGRNKRDAEEALKIVEALEVIFTKREKELLHERGEGEKAAIRIKRISEDAKAVVEDMRSAAQADVDAAEEKVTKVQQALAAHEQTWTADEKKELENLKREADDARRIIMLHESSKAMDMEQQIVSLRRQLGEKAAEAAKLRKEMGSFKGHHARDGGKHQWCRILGDVQLGTTLSIGTLEREGVDLSSCTIQWYQVSTDGGASDLISGAIRPQYAPEPSDVGKSLRAEICLPTGKTQTVQTPGPIEPSRGLEKYVESLVTKGGAQFDVRIVLKNGESVTKQSLHTLDVNKVRIKLHKNLSVKAKEAYSAAMQLCGARGGGDSAAQGLFWVARKGQTFMLVLESERERNAAILLAREFAKLHRIRLAGPGDVVPLDD